MNVHVDRIGREGKRDDGERIAVGRQLLLVGSKHRITDPARRGVPAVDNGGEIGGVRAGRLGVADQSADGFDRPFGQGIPAVLVALARTLSFIAGRVVGVAPAVVAIGVVSDSDIAVATSRP